MYQERFSRDQKEERLDSLEKRERQILYRIIQGKNIPEIAKELRYVPSTVRNAQTLMFGKLGLADLNDEEKREAVKIEYGKRVEEFKTEEEFIQWVKSKPSEIPPSVQRVLEQPSNVPTPVQLPAPPRPRLDWGTIVIIGGILVIFLFFIVLSFQRNPSSSNTLPTTTPEETATISLPQGVSLSTAILSSTSLSTRTSITSPTEAPISTNTPTYTPTQTETPTVSPTPVKLPFFDDFNNKISPKWKILGTEPNTVDGSLISSGLTTLYVGNEAWKDYTVDITAGACWLCPDPTFKLGIRVNDTGMIYFECGIYSVNAYIFRNDAGKIEIPNASISTQSYMDDPDPNYIFTIKGNLVTMTLRGSTSIQFTLTDTQSKTFPRGGVMLQIPPGIPIRYVRIIP